MTLHGAAQFTARLHAIEDTGRVVAEQWADKGVTGVRSQIQRRTGATAASVHADVSREGARIVGSPVVDYLADGTRAHVEVPRNAKALRFQIGGRTIFSKKVYHPATTGNPGIRQAAMNALGNFADALYGLWNRAA